MYNRYNGSFGSYRGNNGDRFGGGFVVPFVQKSPPGFIVKVYLFSNRIYEQMSLKNITQFYPFV